MKGIWHDFSEQLLKSTTPRTKINKGGGGVIRFQMTLALLLGWAARLEPHPWREWPEVRLTVVTWLSLAPGMVGRKSDLNCARGRAAAKSSRSANAMQFTVPLNSAVTCMAQLASQTLQGNK